MKKLLLLLFIPLVSYLTFLLFLLTTN